MIVDRTIAAAMRRVAALTSDLVPERGRSRDRLKLGAGGEIDGHDRRLVAARRLQSGGRGDKLLDRFDLLVNRGWLGVS